MTIGICTKKILMKTCIAVVAASLLSMSGMSAQAPSLVKPNGPAVKTPETTVPTAWSDTHALTADDLAAFMDGVVPLQLHREDIAGAVVIVVKDGNVLFQKGYGYADVDKKTPVTPDGTLFRPGSVSKLFTWTAVMQMVEQGKIDLDRDINDYLDFKIPATYSKPITMRNLMTHTPGYEEAIKDLIVTKGSQPISIGDYLRTHMPERIFAPDTTPAYSNYGATLAGYIVERVSGMPFDDYVNKNVFGPLGMTHSTFRQPLTPALLSMMSSAYHLGSGKAEPYEIIVAEPAGSSATSAADIAHFMFAHLQNGEWNGAHILKPETVAMMHSRQFGVNPSLPGMALGFYEETRNGHRIIGHGGDTQFFHSDLHLIQDANIGFFVSYNSAGRGEANSRGALFNAFLNRYLPYSIPASTKPASATDDAKLVAGEYQTSRRPATNVLSFISFLENMKVTPGEDGTVIVDGLKSDNQVPKTWEEIAPLVYREKNGQDLLGFTKDGDGHYVLAMDYPFMVWTKIGILDSKGFNYFLIILVSVVCLVTLIFWPFSALIRKHYQRSLTLSPGQLRLRTAIRLVCAVDLIFVICWMAILISSGGSPLFDASFDTTLRIVQLIGWIGSLGTLVVLYAVLKNWRAPGEWWLSHCGNALIVVSALSFSWFLLHWHLLHFSLNY